MHACNMCDENGMVMVLPETPTAWETLARCPHNAAALLEIKRNAEADQAGRDWDRKRRTRTLNPAPEGTE